MNGMNDGTGMVDTEGVTPDALDGVTPEELARASFLYFLSHAFGLKPYRHISKIANTLTSSDQEVAIVIPPGHGKSTISSQTFPSWYLGNHPNRSVLLISNTDRQAKLFLASNQQTMEHNEVWARIFPDTAPDMERGWSSDGLFLKWKRDPQTGLALPGWRSKDATDKDPSLAAFGIGGPVIGRRADVIIVDDPYSEDMARSETQRETFLNWFRTTLRSRLKPVPWAKLIVVVTRWHTHDIIAWMQEQNAEEMKKARVEDNALEEAMARKRFLDEMTQDLPPAQVTQVERVAPMLPSPTLTVLPVEGAEHAPGVKGGIL